MHPRISISQICFLGESTEAVAAHWHALGPRNIGLVSPPILAEGVDPIREIVTQGNYDVVTIAHMYCMGQLTRDEAAWETIRAETLRVIDAAATLGCPSIYGLTGGRGGMTWEAAAETFAATIAPCIEPARAKGVTLMVECATPLYAHGTITNNLRDTVILAEIAGIGVCLDTFGCWTEAGLRDTIARAVGLGAIVQVSDYVLGDTSLPCRAVPGDGAIPLRQLIDWTLEAGYQGAFDLELLGPRIEAEGRLDAVRRAADHLGELLVRAGA